VVVVILKIMLTYRIVTLVEMTLWKKNKTINSKQTKKVQTTNNNNYGKSNGKSEHRCNA